METKPYKLTVDIRIEQNGGICDNHAIAVGTRSFGGSLELSEIASQLGRLCREAREDVEKVTERLIENKIETK